LPSRDTRIHTRRMSQTSTERLREYLAQLPPQARALLMREFERAIERGEDTDVATRVLEQLRKMARAPEDDQPRSGELARLFFRPLDPFIVEGNAPVRPGQVRRSSLMPIWQWLVREGAPEQVREYEAAMATSRELEHEIELAIRKLQTATADAILKIIAIVPRDDKQRALARVGPSQVIEDLLPIGAVLKAREALHGFGSRLPTQIRVFGDPQVGSVSEALNVPSLQTPPLLPFALSLIAQRLASPWQIIRLAIKMAASDDETRVAATPYGVAVTIALQDLSYLAACLRTDIRRGHFENVGGQLKILHDGIRGLRTELDLRNDSAWGKQLMSIRADISNALQSEACPAAFAASCVSVPTRTLRPPPGSTQPRSRRPPR
jgi:predicted DNA-binding protein